MEMKARLLLVTAVVALAPTGNAFAETYSPSDRPWLGGVTESTPVAPDDRALRRPDPPQPTLVVRSGVSSFDWADAGIGAASGFGIALALLGGTLMVQRRTAVV
jgi:hypothetical protein